MSCLLILLATLLLASCARNVSEAMEGAEPELPTMVMEKASYRFSSPTIAPIILKAERITIDDKQQQAILSHATFSQTDEEGIQGSSTQIRINTQTHDVALEGDVRIMQPSRGFSISATSISWDNERQVLSSPSDDLVLVTFDGNTIEGVGFLGDLKHDSYEFAKITQGEVET